jgi:hypothetical protein
MLSDDKNKRNLEIVSELTEQNGLLEQECSVLRQQPVSNSSIDHFCTGRDAYLICFIFSQSTLLQLDNFRKTMERDMQKLLAYSEDMQTKMVKYLDGNKIIQEEIQKKGRYHSVFITH